MEIHVKNVFYLRPVFYFSGFLIVLAHPEAFSSGTRS